MHFCSHYSVFYQLKHTCVQAGNSNRECDCGPLRQKGAATKPHPLCWASSKAASMQHEASLMASVSSMTPFW
jgi:hypothetical protein